MGSLGGREREGNKEETEEMAPGEPKETEAKMVLMV
jgi:hypothetical protein